MAVQRRFFCLELETATLIIGFVAFLWFLVSTMAAFNDRYASPVLPFICLLASGSLIHGTVKRNQYFLLPWLIINFAVCVIVAAIILIVFITYFHVIDELDEMKRQIINFSRLYKIFDAIRILGIVAFIIGAAGYSLVVYMYMGIASLYSKLSDENLRKAESDENLQEIEIVHHNLPETC